MGEFDDGGVAVDAVDGDSADVVSGGGSGCGEVELRDIAEEAGGDEASGSAAEDTALPVIVLRDAKVQWGEVAKGTLTQNGIAVVDGQLTPSAASPSIYRFELVQRNGVGGECECDARCGSARGGGGRRCDDKWDVGHEGKSFRGGGEGHSVDGCARADFAAAGAAIVG